mmetsp:Transcript_7379/g.17183  ORF Transcript_7379/g.17183 Transcript_7379/m.17183 type:complete len:108 (+) Transcript_7379:154-477(+)
MALESLPPWQFIERLSPSVHQTSYICNDTRRRTPTKAFLSRRSPGAHSTLPLDDPDGTHSGPTACIHGHRLPLHPSAAVRRLDDPTALPHTAQSHPIPSAAARRRQT